MPSHGKIVIVDDDPVALKVAEAFLRRLGFDVVAHSGSFGTVNLVARQQPDFVLLDVEMPALSGGHIADLLHKNPKTSSVPVILHSGLEQSELEAVARRHRVAGVVRKTSDEATFGRQLQDVLARV